MKKGEAQAAPAAKAPRKPSMPVADEFHGKGGSYVMKDGKRVLQHRTLTAEEAAAQAKETGDAE